MYGGETAVERLHVEQEAILCNFDCDTLNHDLRLTPWTPTNPQAQVPLEIQSEGDLSLFATAVIQILASEYAEGFNRDLAEHKLAFVPMEVLRLSDRNGDLNPKP